MQAVLALALQAAVALALLAAPAAAMAADEPLLLDVMVNGRGINKIGDFVLRDGELLARSDELRSLGIATADHAATRSDDLIALGTLPGLTARLDQPTQTAYITASDDRLLPTLLGPSSATDAAGPIESGTGATLDYDVFTASIARHMFASGLFDARLFSPHGIASTGLIVRSGGGGDYRSSGVIRLDSTYTVSDVAALRRYRFGDFVNGALDWTRPIRMAGVQVIRDFAIRPDFITFPLPSVNGSVAIPSAIDVLVNGTRQFGGTVDAGPFQVAQIPVVSGAGTISTTITNSLGSQVVSQVPFYTSLSLLAPGLQAYSAQFGAIRRDWGFRSNRYGRLAATGTYRRSLSRRLTIEGAVEATDHLVMAGGGIVANIADLALLNIAGAASTSQAGTDAQLSVGLQRMGRVLTLAASAIVAGNRFRDAAAMEGDAIARFQLRANAGLTLGEKGSLGIAYAGVERASRPSLFQGFLPPRRQALNELSIPSGYFLPVQRARILSGSYSVQWRSASIYFTGFRDFARRDAKGLTLSLTVPLGRRSSASASAGAGPGGERLHVQASQTPVSIGDWGYQLAASSGRGRQRYGQVEYRSGISQVSAGIDQTGGRTLVRAGARGSVSWLDGDVFASNTIPDSFAVVDTSGVRNVRVLIENREVGRTDANGRLLVPDLRSFDANHVSIEPLDVPLGADLETTAKVVRPRDRSGVIVRFPVAPSRGALVRLTDTHGRPQPLGSTATLESTGTVVPVGYDGAAYVQNLRAANVLRVEGPDGSVCRARFNYHPVEDAIPEVGPLPCEESVR